MISEGLRSRLGEAFACRKPENVAQRQRARFAEMVAFARPNSPYYRQLYQGLPDRIAGPQQLPATDKKTLMARFDDWVTGREVTIQKVRLARQEPGRRSANG